MVWVERFIIEYTPYADKRCGDRVMSYKFHSSIYDRVKRRKVVDIDTGDEKLDKELAEATLTMLNIKYMGKKIEETALYE